MMSMYLKRMYKDMEFKHGSYINACEDFRDALNEQFYADEVCGIVDDIMYQPSDGFVIVWNENNSVFNIDDIEKIHSRKEFEKYLEDNTI